jgi:hypothetical protein
VFDIATYCTAYIDHIPYTYHNCIYSRHPEDESSGLKQVEDTKLKIEILI